MKSNLWFRRKTYGWGWTPITWQGWTVSALFIGFPLAVKMLMKLLHFTKEIQNFSLLATLPLVTVGLFIVCLRYGEKPRWQWGIKKTKLSQDTIEDNYKPEA